MKWILAILLATAALLLMLPALLIGSVLYVLAVPIFTAAAFFVMHKWPHSKSSNVSLIVLALLSVAALFIGIHPLFPVISLMLAIYAWNAAHRFGHLDHARVEEEAKRQFVIHVLTFSFLPSLAIGLFLIAFLYVRVSLPFGLALGLSIAALLSVALFMGVVRIARNRED
ncbi:hypothetical protein KKG90_07255 [Candidatus Bipolaricaulota bacterium]|nr:hypothetical protein [Candidatus Bipolaricaulota bacterium]